MLVTEEGLEESSEVLRIASNIIQISWRCSQRWFKCASTMFCGLLAAVHLYIFQVILVRAIIPEPSAPEKCFHRTK